MNIPSPLNSPLLAPQGGLPVWERGAPSSAPAAPTSADGGDVISLSRSARLLDDSEVEGILSQTIGMITGNPADAMSAHSGFDPARVAALLA